MEAADFSGYATKTGLKCSDGRTIMPEAFHHMDTKKVPLVWQHGHNDPNNVLGHALLEKRSDGVYAYGYFNETSAGQNAKRLVQHGDITALSIYANQLVERGKQVFHGFIREVSLVLSGANPGALIDFVTIQHSDGDRETLEDEAIIYTGLTLEHADQEDSSDDDDDGTTIQEVYDGLTEEQKGIVHFMVGEALKSSDDDSAQHADDDDDDDDDGQTVQDIYDSFTEKQKNVVHYMIGAALESANETEAKQSDDLNEGDISHKEGTDMTRNVFEANDAPAGEKHVLSHDDMKGIVANAIKTGSLREAVETYALEHGISDIETLFPDARSVDNVPEWQSRRVAWVEGVLNGTRHTPFSRIRTRSADLTQEEARAKGYIKGNMKKEEFFGVSQRVTTPTTIYKKQKLDRDDMLDITDFDVVVWLKGEMRLMLEEELARAILVGDGRDVDDEDKIKDPAGATEGAGIRSILNDHELYVTSVLVNIDDANSSYEEIVDQVLLARRFYKGTGTPTFYTTPETLVRMMLSRDNDGRKLYSTITELTSALMVSKIVEVEVMEGHTDLVGIIVNLQDYAVGADRGGDISTFEDFDIDYNQQKYLMETRVSGALTKMKSALVLRKTAAANVLVAPSSPSFNPATNVVTIPAKTGVVYKNATTNATLTAGAQTALDEGETLDVIASPAAGYYFASNAEDEWSYTNPV